MSVTAQRMATDRNYALSMSLLLLFGSIFAVSFIPNAEANLSGDMSIISSSPSENDFIPAYSPTFFEVTVSNLHQAPSDAREINWFVCVGELNNNLCISNSIDDGSIMIPSLQSGNVSTYTSNDPFYPSGLNETITVVYRFKQNDLNPNNDVISFVLNASLQFTDIMVETDENIIDQISGLAVHENENILSNNTNYDLVFSGFANICSSCSINTTLGWQLWDTEETEIISESYVYVEDYPKLSFYKSFTMGLPTFNHDKDGRFSLTYGIFDSIGAPFGDMYASNNLNTVEILINTEFDVSINSIYPSHNPSSVNYFYGENMINVELSNNGNMTAENILLQLTISQNGNTINTQLCQVSLLLPNQQRNCVFDMLAEGGSIVISAVLDVFNKNNYDSNPLDNILEESVVVIIPQMSTNIEIDNVKDWYTDNEVVSVSANVNPFSPGPVNFSWWYSGIVNIDYGQEININTADYGLGSHNFKLISTDVLGNIEILYFNIQVYTEVIVSQPPIYQASAISASETFEIIHQTSLPTLRETYNLNGDTRPLLLLHFDLVDGETSESMFDGQNWMDIELNLLDSTPPNVPVSSVEIRKLSSLNDTSWVYFNPEHYSLENQNLMSIRIYESTTILLIGNLGEPNIEAQNFTVNLISGGNFELNWNPYGDTESNYLHGWNIHQKIVPDFGGTIFQSPQQGYNENLWEDLVADSFRAFVPLEENSWEDLITVPDGFCTSYAIIPVDRTGNTYNHLANVSMENGTAAFVCGDSTPPSTSIINMQNSWRFTNDTACYDILKDWNLCYEVTISWTWPEGEVDETWNLYRVEQNPNGMDLALLQPVLSDISYVAGENFQFTQNGIDDDTIRPMKTYYYILTPTDQYGNERTVAIYPSANVERVHIENDWWAYNQHVIPELEPEPEPPLNSEWLGNFSDSLDQQEFQTAGIVTLVTLCLGVIMLAFISKRLKRLKRVIGARNRRLAANSMADEFDEFFE